MAADYDYRSRKFGTYGYDVYTSKGAGGKLAAIAVCGHFGAVKEQVAGLYDQTMAKRGFLTLAFDQSFTGESGDAPKFMASPDINTEGFMAAVDFLSVQVNVDLEKNGIIGICGIALNTAALDTHFDFHMARSLLPVNRKFCGLSFSVSRRLYPA